jgi:hypothetical protein
MMNKKIVGLLMTTVASISLTPMNPAFAGLVNNKISNITQDDLNGYCRAQMPAGTSLVQASRGENVVSCTIQVKEIRQGNSGGNGSISANGSGSYGVVNGNVSGSGNFNGSNATRIVYTYRSQAYRLTNYCRDFVDTSGKFFNPFTGEGRVFVGDGGYACYKTIKR